MTEAKKAEEITTLDQHAPAPPTAAEEITTLDQHAPVPPALDLGSK